MRRHDNDRYESKLNISSVLAGNQQEKAILTIWCEEIVISMLI